MGKIIADITSMKMYLLSKRMKIFPLNHSHNGNVNLNNTKRLQTYLNGEKSEYCKHKMLLSILSKGLSTIVHKYSNCYNSRT